MHCPKCDNEIAENSNFCMYCGHRIAANGQDNAAEQVEYEYHVFESSAGEDLFFDRVKAYGAAELNRDGLTEAEARLHFWQEWQAEVLPVFQELTDEGWQPITEIGPACIKLRHSSKRKNKGCFSSLFGDIMPYWELTGAYVKFRRPKTSTSGYEQSVNP